MGFSWVFHIKLTHAAGTPRLDSTQISYNLIYMVRTAVYRIATALTLLLLASTLSCTQEGRLEQNAFVKKQVSELRGYDPESFDLLEPEDGAYDLSLAPEFSWQSSEHATSYIFELDDEDEFEEPLVYQTETDNSTLMLELPVGNLKGSTTYYWRVIAQHNVNEIEATNGPFMFTTRSPWSFGFNSGPKTKTFIVDLLVHPDGGYIVLASVKFATVTQSYPILVRFGPSGSLEWAKRIGTPGMALYPSAIVRKPDGGYVLAANEESSLRTFNAWIFDLDELGKIHSAHCYGDNKNSYELKSIAAAPHGGFVAGGTIQEAVGYDNDPWLVKLDAGLTEEWQKRYTDSEHNYMLSSLLAVGDGIIMTGVQDKAIVDRFEGRRFVGDSLLGQWSPERPTANRAWIAKISYDGECEGAHSFDHGKAYTFPVAIAKTAQNGYIVLANQVVKRLPYVGMMLLERDLTPRWEHWYVGGSESLVQHGSLAKTPSGTFTASVVGTRYGQPEGWLFKLASDGGHIWRESLAGDYDVLIATTNIAAVNDGSIIAGGSYAVPRYLDNYDIHGIVMLLDPDGEELLDDDSGLMLEPLTIQQISDAIAPSVPISLEAIDSEVSQLDWEYVADDATADITITPLSGDGDY